MLTKLSMKMTKLIPSTGVGLGTRYRVIVQHKNIFDAKIFDTNIVDRNIFDTEVIVKIITDTNIFDTNILKLIPLKGLGNPISSDHPKRTNMFDTNILDTNMFGTNMFDSIYSSQIC